MQECHTFALFTFRIRAVESQLFLMPCHFVLGDNYLALADCSSLSSQWLLTLSFFSFLNNLCLPLSYCQVVFASSRLIYKERKKWGEKRSSPWNLILAPVVLVLSPQVVHHAGLLLHVTAAARTTRVMAKARVALRSTSFQPPARRASRRPALPREQSSEVQSAVSRTLMPRSRPSTGHLRKAPLA